MICPKCKREIEQNSLKCSYCGIKLGSLCKNCGTYNSINKTECAKCGNVLLRICSECNSANLPDAKSCRKCGIQFVTEFDKKTVIKPQYNVANSQQKVKEKLIEGIKDADLKIITLSGESGSGKNLVLRHAINELKNARLIWLLGTCSQVTQLSPFGYFQDMLLAFFNINNFCPDTLQLKKNSIKFFKQDFPSLTQSEIIDLLNFLYPDSMDKYENIYYNKAKMFLIIKKILLTIVEKTKVIFIIDNIEYIDGMSFDFIRELLNEEEILERTKFIILTRDTKPGMGLIPSAVLTENNYLNLTIDNFSPMQVETFLKQYSNLNAGKDYINFVNKISGGNPSVLEQLVLLNMDINNSGVKNYNYNSLDSVIALRLELLQKDDVTAYRMLIAMSVLGVKFYPAILENFDNNDISEFERIIDKLVDIGFITRLNNLAFEFKTDTIWKAVVAYVKNDIRFEEILNMLYDLLTSYKQSSIAMVGYIVQKLNNHDQAFNVWTTLMKQSAYIGDIGLYIIAQKQALKLIENKSGDFYNKVKRNIYTRVGKLLEPIDHVQAFEFLQNAIMYLDEGADVEHVELLGYLASCSMKLGNYWGAIECVDSVLNKLPENMELERLLLKSRQTTPLLKLGNYGQLNNCIETEILSGLEKFLTKGKKSKIISLDTLFEVWLKTYFNYAESLVFQGDNKAYEIISIIFDILEKNQVKEPAINCKAHLLLALANTIKGDFNTSKQILDDILKDYTLDDMDSYIVSRWNFIDILNKFFEKDYTTLHTELFNVVAYANNANDSFTKNILKTLLAKILKDNNQTKKALEILEEQVAYFAKEKVATGVLLSWYLIAKIRLITSGTQFALDIATKALDIAQGPSINNYYFIALFYKLIGEIYLAKQDYESSKVYLEKSVFIAKRFDMQYILIKAYLQCAKLYQELALPKSSKRSEYIKQDLKMFQLAKNVPIVANQAVLQKTIKEELNILLSFCKLNGIILKKESK